jgi:ubiquinone/menaquinone biosynthesis C-methylase UbiE
MTSTAEKGSARARACYGYVRETRFGVWFLSTDTWRVRVLRRALDDLRRMAPDLPTGCVVLDIGTGQGQSLRELTAAFSPSMIHALDPDPDFSELVAENVSACASPVTLHPVHAERIDLPDASVDLVFCHQSLHHIVGQEEALGEMYRVLRPGGHLLLAESCARYIRSWTIRFLFRHPMHVQRTATEYLDMLRAAGFEVREDRISMPFLWWSRPDLGFFEWIGCVVPEVREETLVNVVARKPSGDRRSLRASATEREGSRSARGRTPL